jgi:UTP:GlnB (protein PII) uridylyltransferase
MKDFAKPGLLSRILGILYACDLSVNRARVASTTGENPIALDVISVAYQNNPLPTALSAYVADALRKCLNDESLAREMLVSHGKDPERAQAMFEYRFFEGELGILEIETPLGRGMPYRVARMLAEHGWNVHVARIGQWAGRAVARFYLDKQGEPLTAEVVQRALALHAS